ncbi:MAG: carboxypeptidase regulatory-like domain-containing protein [Vicinamibacterales bacterium]
MPTRTSTALLATLALCAATLLAAPGWAQTTAVVQGVALDQDGGALPGATVELLRPTTGFASRTVTGPDGRFAIANVPFGRYELAVGLDGFRTDRRAVDALSTVPVELTVTLGLEALASTVTVTAVAPLVDDVSGGTRHQLGSTRIETLPAAVGSRGIETVLATFPGFAVNANGAIHPRGAHNQMTYLIDGLPVSDQLTGAFANALDAGIVHSVELMTGHIPAQFGGKVSGVAVVTTKSGAGVGRPLAGDVTLSGAGFGTSQVAAQAGGGTASAGYFISGTAMRTSRFLDQISRDNLHNDGGFGRLFFRGDVAPSPATRLRVNAMGGRSAFELANLRSQQARGQDQRQALSDVAVWGTALRTLGSTAALESTFGLRHSTAALLGSEHDAPVTATQDRSLRSWTASVRYTRQAGPHQFLVGADAQRIPVRERFQLAITDGAFNMPDTPGYNQALTAHDLTRGGAPFVFADAGTGHAAGVFGQAVLRARALTATLGLRHDEYAFLVRARGLQPRASVALTLPGPLGVLRASVNRNLQTPPNENLLLSNSQQAAALAPEGVRRALGDRPRVMQPERQTVVEAGWQAGVGGFGTLDVSAYRKRSTDQQDNNNFFDTGIIFPVTLAAIDTWGVEGRVSLRERKGVSGSLSVTTGRATSTPPFTGGLFLGQDAVDLLSAGPFLIDHDQRLSLQGTVSANLPGPLWVSGAVRYDSGLVANPSDPAEVAADHDFADLLPYVNLTGAVARVRPRTLADVVAGWDVRDARGRQRWSIQAQVTNLTNRTALYNFQSVFVGTRLVQPRTFALRVRRSF